MSPFLPPMAGLPEEAQTVLRMRYWDNKSYHDMARALGSSRKATSKLLIKALAMLSRSIRIPC